MGVELSMSFRMIGSGISPQRARRRRGPPGRNHRAGDVGANLAPSCPPNGSWPRAGGLFDDDKSKWRSRVHDNSSGRWTGAILDGKLI